MSSDPCSSRGAFRARLFVSLGAALATILFAEPIAAQQTFTGGGAITVSGSSSTASGSSTLNVSGATGSTVATVKVQLNGVTTDGQTGDSMYASTFVLKSPNGTQFVLLGNTGDSVDGDDLGDGGSGLSSVTITVQDGASGAPNASGAWPHTGSITVKPSSYWVSDSFSLPLSGVLYPSSDGSATLTSAFTNAPSTGNWTLTIQNSSFATPVSISSWYLTLTYATVSLSPTTTTISSGANPVNASNNVTFTANVSGSSGTVTGTVVFSANGSTLSGCSAVPVSSGFATCTIPSSGLGQGLSTVKAAYSGSSTYSSSSTTMNELVEVTPTHTNDTWCNNNSMSMSYSTAPQAYPSFIHVTGYNSGATVGNVTVKLTNVSWSGQPAQHLLVAPGGSQNLDFFDSVFAYQNSTVGPFTFTVTDGAGVSPSPSGTPAAGTYTASDNNINFPTWPSATAPSIDSSISQVPGTINFAPPIGSATQTFVKNFNGAPANGDWALYSYYNVLNTETIGGGWCITLDVNTGVGTTTKTTSSVNPAPKGNSVTLTATVKEAVSGNPVSSGGTVTFAENNAAPAGTVSGNNTVSLNSSGQGTFTTSSLTEGDHQIVATYNGDTADNISQDNSFWQRIDNWTTMSSGSGGSINYCNANDLKLPAGTTGGATPNPSNIFVSSLPGTIKAVTLSLQNLSSPSPIYDLESLVKGPTGAALDFFSNTSYNNGSGTVGTGTYTFSDSAGSTVGQTNLSPGTYLPSAYQNPVHSTDSFISSSSGFYNAPSSFNYATPQGSATLASTFANTNPNGTWSLFFNETGSQTNAFDVAGGWCLNFTTNPVTVSVSASHAGSGGAGSDFQQTETGAGITVTVTNQGSGSTGDPTGTNPLKVVDTLNSALTYTGFSGTGWSCAAVGQTVTCTNDSAVAQLSSYPTLTLNVNVSASAPASVSNQVSVSGAGITSNSATDTINIDPAANLTLGMAHTGTFTQGQNAEWDVTVNNTGTGGQTSGTITVSDTLPTGYTLVSSTPAAWSCGGVSNAVTCTSTTAIAAGSSSTIHLTVAVPASSATSVSNSATAWGGGDPAHTSQGTAVTSNVDTVSVAQVPAAMSIFSGDSQSTQISTAFPTALVAVVTDAASVVIPSASVTFTVTPGAGGQSGVFSNATGTITTSTDVNGHASETITANSTAGAYTVSATAGSVSKTWNLTNIPGAPANISVYSGNAQSAYDTTSFTSPLKALVIDSGGNVVPGATVTFSAPAQTGASVIFAGGVNTATTDATGVATSAAITANSHLGTYNVTAGVNALTVNFQLTNSIGPVSQLVVSAPATAISGVPTQFTVTAQDVGGNTETSFGDTLHFTSTDNGATPPSDSTLTAGSSSFTITLNSPGSQTITATDTSSSLFGTSAGISVSAVPVLVVTTAADDTGTASNCTVQATAGIGTDAACSLRDALLEAASLGAGNVSFDSTVFASPGTITLSNGVLTVPAYTSITGPTSANRVTVNGNSSSGVFSVSGSAVSITNLTITNGSSASGGGITNNGTLTLAGCTVSGNTASGFGGGINNQGTLHVNFCTFSGNGSTEDGGAIFNTGSTTVNNSTFVNNSSTAGSGGAVLNADGVMSIVESTFAQNVANQNGGAIRNLSTLSLAASTVSGNSAATGGGGGLYNDVAPSIANSIVAGNAGVSYADVDGTFTDAGGNQAGGDAGSNSTIAIKLASIGNYGGSMQTMLPLPGSPAICSGLPSNIVPGVQLDERGMPNINLNYPGYSGENPCVDSGAVQTNYLISFSQQPSTFETMATEVQNVPITPAPQVQVSESGINIDGATIMLSGAPVGVSGSTSQTSAGGVATFSNISIPQLATDETLTGEVQLSPSAGFLMTSSLAFKVVAPPAVVLPRPGSKLNGSTVPFQWSGGPAFSLFKFTAGTTGPGSSNLYSGMPSATTLATVSKIPTQARTVYVRLSFLLNGNWYSQDFTYTEAGAGTAPALNTPPPGTALTSSTVTFSWTRGAATSFKFELGTTGVGASDVYHGNPINATSVIVKNIPSGKKLYARLEYMANGVWHNLDYIYGASSPIRPLPIWPQPPVGCVNGVSGGCSGGIKISGTPTPSGPRPLAGRPAVNPER